MTKTLKINKIIASVLVVFLTVCALTVSLMALLPKTKTVNAAETSTTLAQNWHTELGSIDIKNIASLTITTTASKIDGYSQGKDVSEAQDGSLYYYYQKTSEKVDADGDGVLNDDSYNIIIFSNVQKIYAPENSSSLFALFGHNTETGSGIVSNVKSIKLENFDTTNAKNMYQMFVGCSSLTNLYLGSNFVTNNVTDMGLMFALCSSLTNLNLSEWDTNKVTDISSMFGGCSALTTINAKGIKFNNTTVKMFKGLSSLKTLDLSKADTSNVTDMSNMFLNCSQLTYVNTSNFDTSKVTNFFGMFAGCSAVEVLDLSSFSFESVTSAQGVLGMLGINDTLVLDTLQSYGATDLLAAYQQAMMADENEGLAVKKQVVAIALENLFNMTAENAATTAENLFNTNIHTIYAPVSALNNQSIALPYNNNGIYVYDNGSGEQETQFLVGRGSLEQMAIYPKGDTPTILPPDVGEIDPDTPESGVTLVDLLILTMLTLTLSGVCVIILKNKNKGLNKR